MPAGARASLSHSSKVYTNGLCPKELKWTAVHEPKGVGSGRQDASILITLLGLTPCALPGQIKSDQPLFLN